MASPTMASSDVDATFKPDATGILNSDGAADAKSASKPDATERMDTDVPDDDDPSLKAEATHNVDLGTAVDAGTPLELAAIDKVDPSEAVVADSPLESVAMAHVDPDAAIDAYMTDAQVDTYLHGAKLDIDNDPNVREVVSLFGGGNVSNARVAKPFDQTGVDTLAINHATFNVEQQVSNTFNLNHDRNREASILSNNSDDVTSPGSYTSDIMNYTEISREEPFMPATTQTDITTGGAYTTQSVDPESASVSGFGYGMPKSYAESAQMLDEAYAQMVANPSRYDLRPHREDYDTFLLYDNDPSGDYQYSEPPRERTPSRRDREREKARRLEIKRGKMRARRSISASSRNERGETSFQSKSSTQRLDKSSLTARQLDLLYQKHAVLRQIPGGTIDRIWKSGSQKSINMWTSFSHPMQLWVSDLKLCHFCTYPLYCLVGWGPERCVQLKGSQTGSYREARHGGGYFSEGFVATRVCEKCCRARLRIMNCRNHEMETLERVGSRERMIDVLSGSRGRLMEHELRKWCSICRDAAIYSCTKECGLRLCARCNASFTVVHNGDLSKFIEWMEGIACTRGIACGVRADATLLSRKGLLAQWMLLWKRRRYSAN